jgi:peptidoglycan/xylan/chitin deacetylase (PgdA/CDA1 family)
MNKRYWVLSIFCSLLAAGFILLAAWLPKQYQVPILAYHAVAPEWFEPLNNVQPEHFDDQMAYLRKQGYKVLSLSDFIDVQRSGREHDRKSVVVTFDDGYENNYTAAYPVLKKYNIPAVIFVEVGHLEGAGYLTWQQAKEMNTNGIDIESHTLAGAYLPRLTHEQVVIQITESKRVLEDKLGHRIRFFAYPIGGFSEDIKQIVREAGYEAAVTTNRGYARVPRDLYELKRIRIKDSDGAFQLWFKLSGYYNFFRGSKKPF